MPQVDLTSGKTSAQPWNAHEAVSIITFSYDAAVDGGVSGTDYKLVDIPENAVLLSIKADYVGGADVGDTITMGTTAGGTDLVNTTTLTATVTSTSLINTSNLLVGSGAGVWLRPGATFTAATVSGKAVVAYTNLYTP